MIRTWNRAAALSLIAALAAMPVSAQTASSLAVQNYPDRPIKLVSPFPPGGPTDVMARLIGGQMAKVLGQPVIIENRAGAAGAIGADFVAKAVPDGYTVCYCTTGPLVTLPLLDSKLPYQPSRDLLPVSQVNRLELVLIARNGLEAIDKLQHDPGMDLVLMDIMMPEMDGYETMREIRKQPEFRNLPILALTAKAMKGDREKCLEAGASDYIAKPVNTDQLLSLLRVWLHR